MSFIQLPCLPRLPKHPSFSFGNLGRQGSWIKDKDQNQRCVWEKLEFSTKKSAQPDRTASRPAHHIELGQQERSPPEMSFVFGRATMSRILKRGMTLGETKRQREERTQRSETSAAEEDQRARFASVRSQASVVMRRLSYPTETVLSNNITRNRIDRPIIQRQSQKTITTET